ncbi:hypothetical protein T10_7181 [Trichinella papuae]|uniref:Uncharacterized protein n=1 Tax=Trichinella papuae TaxID=268474 RepID=A0A0V1N0E1_9BILA|nr:hypothetical protein T10_7181 [Trichinella papuae]
MFVQYFLEKSLMCYDRNKAYNGFLLTEHNIQYVCNKKHNHYHWKMLIFSSIHMSVHSFHS